MISLLERLIFSQRKLVVAIFAVITVFMAWSATSLKVDAGFAKLLPLQHEYMQTFVDHRDEFGGANRILIALTTNEGDIFTAEFFETLRQVTDEVFFIPGVDRARVSSLFTPNVRFTEVVEDGISGGPVIPADFDGSEASLARVRANILKSRYMGLLVANDFSGALISAQLMEIDPRTGERLNYIEVAKTLEARIRDKFDSNDVQLDIGVSELGMDVHIIGFAKVVGDISEGAARVITFFVIAFLVTALLVWYYAQSLKIALIPLVCSLVAVIWQLGLLPLLGFGIDPMSILVPFLVFAIGVSHGVQMISSIGSEVYCGADYKTAACCSFRRLVVPGGIALASDTIGFITILLIDIGIIREMAITASLGVAVIILTNLVLLPVVVSFLGVDEGQRQRLQRRSRRLLPFWRKLSTMASRGPATVAIGIGLGLLAIGLWQGTSVRIGDLHSGVPELREDSRYNLDSALIAERFAIGVDVLSVIVEGPPDGCVDHTVMSHIDRFGWQMENVPGVQSVVSLTHIARRVNAGWNEGALAWRILPRHPQNLGQAVNYTPTSSGLLNDNCSVMPVLIYTADHKAETIERVVQAVKRFRDEEPMAGVELRLATGNVGVMAATNEAVSAAQFPMLIYVFAAIIGLCLITFRSLAATLCIVLPLALVSLLAYALMAVLEIGLKVNTLPVVALGVGIGVDYGIYIFSRLRDTLAEGGGLREAYERTLEITGSGVVFTGVTLAIGVATWIFSPLKFQADMGILLTFMFLVNMLGAIFLLPALAYWLMPGTRREAR